MYRFTMSRWFIIIVVLGLLVPTLYGERRRTTRRNLQVKPDAIESSVSECWFEPDSGLVPVRFCGYEKKQNANKETLFVVNLSDSTFERLSFTITYLDTSNREIHKRSVMQTVELPPHETRRIDFRSWDTQKSYYYAGGPAPRRSATPYNITISLDSILISSDASY